ncbi:MAG: CidA/LrgA family protein, partial [Bacteroidota bacterium]
MLLIFVGLYMGIVKENEIENIAKQLIKLLNLFFIPAGVGLLAHEKLIQENLLIIITSSIISSLVLMFVAAKVFLMMKK